jgi:hypothetical protein
MPPTQPHPLEGCRQKVLRALAHLEELHEAIRPCAEGDFYTVDIKRKGKSPWRTGHIHLEDMPLTLWSVMLGDVLHNCRSALDHLVYRLSTLKANDKRRGGLQFPVFSNENEYRKPRECGRPSASETMLCGVADEHRKIIEGLQPFEVGKDANLTALARLSSMHNRDKHRLVNIAQALIGPNEIQIHPEGGNRHELKVLKPKKLESGDPLFRFRTFPDTDAEVNVRTKVPMRIGFGTPPADIDFIKDSIISGVFEIVKGFEDIGVGS